ncbi:MAG: bifunctional folylpolyglutamate synthase/dihydrofolate synthase [Muribaculaceae bacterium]|nr:bifunctional folylpolyglutamate synthase/dihydrofolate synthase [Muribaculaceae bacterium]
MTYTEATEYLFNALPMFQSQGAGAYKPGLDTVRTLAAAFGDPQRRLRCIHIGGTNGKGSTAHSLAAILAASGLTVGLFTSPHLVDFRERIRINGNMISEAEVVDFTERFLANDKLRNLQPSFFELTTIMALEFFARRRVDVAVVEVGLGGRLDSTNIIMPDLCVVTNISLDHTALLGDTAEAIAYEKAGIFKPDVPVVISEAYGSVRKVFEQKALATGCPIYFACDEPLFKAASQHNDHIIYTGTPWGELHGELCGDCQKLNTAGILTAVKVLEDKGYPVTGRAIADGLAHVCEMTGLSGRWSTIRHNPDVVCDTGHNIGGWQYLAPRLERESRRLAASDRRLHVILGFVNDKNIDPILELLATVDADFHFVAPDIRRARPAAELAAEAARFGIRGSIHSSVAEGYEKTLAEAGEGDMIFVGGSTFVVAEISALR